MFPDLRLSVPGQTGSHFRKYLLSDVGKSNAQVGILLRTEHAARQSEQSGVFDELLGDLG